MGRVTFTSLRALQLTLSLASIGLSAYVVNDYNQRSRHSAPSPFAYLIVSSIFSIFSITYLALSPLLVPRVYHQYAAVVVEAVNAALYFAGFIAVAVFIGSLLMCEGTVCSTARADAVVAAGQFTAWITTTAFTAKEMFKRAFREPSKEPESQEMGQA
ncbi:hypothetical protein F66182_9756 [Fusarium sp. NRRL 66182]|nr:hypothetical protein F66182_9756 [Fusarium sp. NRRL 66182]